MEEKYCQSCGMPLTRKEDIATNKDGSPMYFDEQEALNKMKTFFPELIRWKQ